MTKKITVLLTDNEYLRFQTYCEAHGYKKSTLIARLIRDLLEAERLGGSQGAMQESGHQSARESGNNAADPEMAT